MLRPLPHTGFIRLLTLLAAVSCPGLDGGGVTRAEPHREVEFFETRIRPVLVENCLPCHGMTRQESGLRLDSHAALLRGGDRGPCVQRDNPGDSRLLTAVRYIDDDLKMPPDKRLDESAIQDLTNWIAAGAPWPESVGTLGKSAAEHWAFQPIQQPELPLVSHQEWIRHPIDRFVLAKLESRGLTPSPPGDRRTLLRRLTFNLIGMPPTAVQLDRFLADNRPDAYERLVDELLASPQYGERWGRHWLDVARYADTKGYVFFEDGRYPWAFTYRDYVIRAWNADLPFDRFITEQLAADLLSPTTTDSLAALGFLTVGGHFMNNTHDIVDDRMDVVMRGLLGLTFTCARCHDHKYDPIPQEDYYGLYGILRSCYEPTVPPLVGPVPHTDTYRSFAAELTAREQKLVDFVTAKHSELVGDARARIQEYLTAIYRTRDQPPADDFMLVTDKGDLNPAIKLRWHAYLHDTRQLHDSIWRPWRELAALTDAEFSQRADDLLMQVVQGESSESLNPLVRAALAAITQVSDISDIATAYHSLIRRIDDKWHDVCRVAKAAGQPAPLRFTDPYEEELRGVLYGVDSPVDAPMTMEWGFLSLLPDRSSQDEYKKLLKELEEWMMSDQAPARAMVLFDSDTPCEPRIFRRGNPYQPGSKVTRHVPALIDPVKTPIAQGSGRRELARQITNRTNPLTARVLVNRLWLYHFGRGLVGTPGDFGLRGDSPTHPELLDWLASELRGDPHWCTSPWSMKRLQRAIVLSSTFRQASTPRRDGLAADPENLLLWRMNPQRLDLEAQRDAMLAVADALDHRIGGPSLDIWGDALVPRRTIYGAIDRLNLPPILATFDFPNPAATSAQRLETTVSPQALFFMNHPTVLEAAQDIAGLPEIQQLTQTPARARALYLRLFAREPSPSELEAAQAYLGSNPTADAWTQYVHGLLLTNEFAFIR